MQLGRIYEWMSGRTNERTNERNKSALESVSPGVFVLYSLRATDCSALYRSRLDRNARRVKEADMGITFMDQVIG